MGSPTFPKGRLCAIIDKLIPDRYGGRPPGVLTKLKKNEENHG